MKKLIPFFKLMLLILSMTSNLKSEVIKGTFKYSDLDPLTNTSSFKPIRFAYVEIWSTTGPSNAWRVESSIATDEFGNININMPFKSSKVQYAIRILAQNYACRINKQKELTIFYANPTTKNREIIKNAKRHSDILDFSCDFADIYISQHFNVAETIRQGYDYASAHRDPSETDIIEPVIVTSEITLSNSYYLFTSSAIQLRPESYFQDLAILHEYGHHLQNYIGYFAAVPTYHNNCEARRIRIEWFFQPGEIINNADIAWMEGFADFFAQAVVRANPTESFFGNVGTPSVGEIEFPFCGPLRIEDTPDEIEIYVASVLWDLIDNPLINPNEIYDDFQNMDDNIFHIFDKDLDNGTVPTLSKFVDAWNIHGLRRIDKIMCQNSYMLKNNFIKRFIVPKTTFSIIDNNKLEVQIEATDECGDLTNADIYDSAGNLLGKTGSKFIVNINCNIQKKKITKVVNPKPLITAQVPCEIITCTQDLYTFILKKIGYPDSSTWIKISKNTCK